MTALGWAEEARPAAAPTLISLGGSPPSDTSSPALMAWRLAQDAGNCLQATLATLAVLAAHTIAAAGRPSRRRLHERFDATLQRFPRPLHTSGYQAALQRIADDIERQVHPTGRARGLTGSARPEMKSLQHSSPAASWSDHPLPVAPRAPAALKDEQLEQLRAN